MTEISDRSEAVAVIIAARDAADTIAHAVASALAEPEVSEVVVVDDASHDDTGAVARAAGGGDGRLRVVLLSENVGPAAARNVALRSTSAPLIAILDADDAFRPGRFAHLLSLPKWDMAADNVAFTDRMDAALPEGEEFVRNVDLEAFVRGNISRNGTTRGELGFLKPVIRRSFLEDAGLLYDEDLRLGEDYDLYVRALLAGARFAVSYRVGYVARLRENSLSALHRADDLRALLSATTRHFASASDAGARAAITLHRKQIADRLLLRDFLAEKRTGGIGRALAFATVPPNRLYPIATGVLSDKLNAIRGKDATQRARRTLLAEERVSS